MSTKTSENILVSGYFLGTKFNFSNTVRFRKTFVRSCCISGTTAYPQAAANIRKASGNGGLRAARPTVDSAD